MCTRDQLRTAVRNESLVSEFQEGLCKLCDSTMTSKSDYLYYGLMPSEMEVVMNQEMEENRTAKVVQTKSVVSSIIWRESLLKRHISSR